MTTFLLVRHGETDWNREHRWQGHTDVPLNELGREQARALAEELVDEPIAAVYSSDLLRAYETATAIAERRGLDVIVDAALREIHLGSWEGMTSGEIELTFPDDFHRWREGELVLGRGGETSEQLRVRVLGAAHRIAAAHPGEQVAIVSHGGALRALAIHAEAIEEDRRFENCAVVRIVYRDGGFRRVD